ncbi:MAG: GTP cyclohydrolase FolE2 [Deltaproteobacteria bacterium]|jgi:GTP cyclohydrolase I|nr:GTP cyclohydrolase FolE2 [Deltaproteobacteria bacterium]
MIDIQNRRDNRRVEINKVGVKNIQYPITVLNKRNKVQHTVGKVNMYVNLPHHFKGTHMSRFVEILNEYRGTINIKAIATILDKMKEKLNAQSAYLEVEFPYFVEKRAPVSGAKSLMGYTCQFLASLTNGHHSLVVGIIVPVTTLCPCSKEISKKGAHNQRSLVTVKVTFRKFFWIEDLIRIVENSASSAVYSLLKRSDEKFLTERAYDNPMFVEDVVRNIALRLHPHPNITWYRVESENLESIHNHNAYACVEKEGVPHPFFIG